MERYKTIYRYYSTQRPVSPGTFPEPPGNSPINITNFKEKTHIDSIIREAWGCIDYEKPLSEKDAQEYELTEVIGFFVGEAL